MSLTALAWITCFLLFSLRGLRSPIHACYAYLLTFFAAPQLWWWGGSLVGITYSWNLFAALQLAVSVLINAKKMQAKSSAANNVWKWCILLQALYALNVLAVHYSFALDPEVSWRSVDLAWKQFGLTILLYYALSSAEDLKKFLFAVLIGCTYIGYEAVINEAGSFHEGRLEGILVPGASNSNGLSAMLTMGLFTGSAYVLLRKSLVSWAFVAIACVLVLDTLLRCNSRGAFLGLICGGGWFVIASKGVARKQLIGLSFLGLLVLGLQARDQFIWERFETTFASDDERDSSAASRLDFWAAACELIADYPLGAGGEAAFRSDVGMTYIDHLEQNKERAVHNGYLDITAGWGIQGITFMCGSILVAFAGAWKVTRRQPSGALEPLLIGSLLQAMLVAQLVSTIFLSRLDHEVFNWMIVLCAVYCREYSPAKNAGAIRGSRTSRAPGMFEGVAANQDTVVVA